MAEVTRADYRSMLRGLVAEAKTEISKASDDYRQTLAETPKQIDKLKLVDKYNKKVEKIWADMDKKARKQTEGLSITLERPLEEANSRNSLGTGDS